MTNSLGELERQIDDITKEIREEEKRHATVLAPLKQKKNDLLNERARLLCPLNLGDFIRAKEARKNWQGKEYFNPAYKIIEIVARGWWGSGGEDWIAVGRMIKQNGELSNKFRDFTARHLRSDFEKVK